MIRGIEKKDIFENKHDKIDTVLRLGELAKETKTPIYAWSIMSNHIHILLKNGPRGLSNFMRRLLTGYSINYNLRHRRFGHLFQNRYKSIVCDEDYYFKELVRYIHLNPLRAGLVKGVAELDRYAWSGHNTIMGNKKREWQDTVYVLEWFGKSKGNARNNYRNFVKSGVEEGRRNDLVGGGLIRTLGGWSQVLSQRKQGEKILSDARILGQDKFVERVINEADNRIKRQVSVNERKTKAEKKIHEECKSQNIRVEELRGGSRRGKIPTLRARLAIELVKELGLTSAETARQLGVSTPAISRILVRNCGD